ncbi:GMC family oxidoreductase [Flavobacteriaceae bacterium]|nr:GMC family oxidoreductase [Flavobacteriaceae bacterium]
MNFTDNVKNESRFDAIVVGTGITGGWASKELTENGLNTLVLERGRMVEHIKDYPTMNLDPWDFEHRGRPTREDRRHQPKQERTGYTTGEASKHWFVDDLKHPYEETKRFDWIRGYHVGGRSLLWARMSFRWSPMDFEANAKDGYGVDWPIRYEDLKPWYEKVEKYVGITGKAENLPQLPDSIFTPEIPLNCVEEEFQKGVAEHFDDRQIINGRSANLTGDAKEGRSPCQFRNRCIRGCPFGGYFSSNSSTLPAADRTGKMTLRPHSIVHEVIYDEQLGKATGVRIIDAETKESFTYYADIVFLCASAVASTSILMMSKSKRFPNGLGNDCGELGHNMMDHHFKVGATGEWDGNAEDYYKGRKPIGFFVPRFRNLPGKEETHTNYLRGYGMQGSASRQNWMRAIGEMSYGEDLKNELVKPGTWQIGVNCFGECLPYHDNKMSLNYDKLDEWGLPTVDFDVEYKENERLMREDAEKEAVKMLTMAGFKNVKGYNRECYPGNGIHEMGTARMGKDSKTSVLNKYNQVHGCENVYVTDGACMSSSASQNPSLTYMALTARAANHAAKEFKKQRNG